MIPCPNIGCDNTFPYRMAKLCHLKKCNRIPPEPIVEKVDDHWVYKVCKVHIRHQNNLPRHLIPDVDSASSNTSMLNDVEVSTDFNTIPCSSQMLSSSDIPEAELNSSNMSTTTETQALDLSEVPEVELNRQSCVIPHVRNRIKRQNMFREKSLILTPC